MGVSFYRGFFYSERRALSEKNASSEAEVGALLTSERTISMPCRLCPKSV